MTDEDLKLYRGIAAQRDLYLKALRELVSVPGITVAEHAGETPWLKSLLAKVKDGDTGQHDKREAATPPDISEAAAALWGCTEPGARTQIYDACERARCKAYKFNAVLTELIGK